jgi:hypothetical protein
MRTPTFPDECEVELRLLKGIRVIWQSISKFHILLFILLCATSLLLLMPLPSNYKPLVISCVAGGAIYFLGLTLLAAIPRLWKALGFLLGSTSAEIILFALTWLLTFLFSFSLFTLIEIIVAVGALIWLINLSIMACVLPYSVSARLAHHSPRTLGWVFFLLMGFANAIVYIMIAGIHVLEPFLYAYIIGWLIPCVLISIVKYRDARIFVGYMLVALVYSLYPIGYRIYSLLSETLWSQGPSASVFIGIPIEEVITVFMFAWALNSVGRLANNEYKLFIEGKEKLKNKFTSPLRILKREHGKDEQREAFAAAAGLFEEFKEERLAVNPFLVFGLLFSALAYFAFRHSYAIVGVPSWIEPGVALVLSMVATVPLLFYMIIKRNKDRPKPASGA